MFYGDEATVHACTMPPLRAAAMGNRRSAMRPQKSVHGAKHYGAKTPTEAPTLPRPFWLKLWPSKAERCARTTVQKTEKLIVESLGQSPLNIIGTPKERGRDDTSKDMRVVDAEKPRAARHN